MTSQMGAIGELLSLVEDYHDYNPRQVPCMTAHPTAVHFTKQVGKGFPCVYPAQRVLQGSAAEYWTKKKLIDAVRDKVEVAVTPNGRADSLHTVTGSEAEKVFLQPANINMHLASLFDLLDATEKANEPVYYLQSQNSNLTSTALQPLLQDLPSNFDFAGDVLGEPEAINIWIGDNRSVTSAHRDPYENLYIVLRGSKTFTLWAPVDEVCMDIQLVRTGHFTFDTKSSRFDIAMDEDSEPLEPPSIPWVSVDPQLPREELNQKHPLYQHARPMTVEVAAGQMLYLPSGWFHHVSQKCGVWDDESTAPCIAVNYWYDMDYEGEKYVTRQLISRLIQTTQLHLPGKD